MSRKRDELTNLKEERLELKNVIDGLHVEREEWAGMLELTETMLKLNGQGSNLERIILINRNIQELLVEQDLSNDRVKEMLKLCNEKEIEKTKILTVNNSIKEQNSSLLLKIKLLKREIESSNKERQEDDANNRVLLETKVKELMDLLVKTKDAYEKKLKDVKEKNRSKTNEMKEQLNEAKLALKEFERTLGSN